MSKAKIIFESSIKDAEELLGHFDAINTRPPPDNAEVLKRAGFVMALTAWETYVEDRVREEFQIRSRAIEGSHVGKFIAGRLEEELKRFHNPNAEKTKRIFQDYLGVDVTVGWTWNQMDPLQARKTLDALIAKRGDAVHCSKPPQNGLPAAHLVRREELEKAIRFLKSLVEATDRMLDI